MGDWYGRDNQGKERRAVVPTGSLFIRKSSTVRGEALGKVVEFEDTKQETTTTRAKKGRPWCLPVSFLCTKVAQQGAKPSAKW